jgi:beta-mannosidase
VRTAEAEEPIVVAPHSTIEHSVEAMLGRFVDSGLAYGFGPPGHDLVVASLWSLAGPVKLLSQAFRFSGGRPQDRVSAARRGVDAHIALDDGHGGTLTIRAEQLLYGVRLKLPGLEPEDDFFSLEPGVARRIRLYKRAPQPAFAGGSLSAINLNESIPIQLARA